MLLTNSFDGHIFTSFDIVCFICLLLLEGLGKHALFVINSTFHTRTRKGILNTFPLSLSLSLTNTHTTNSNCTIEVNEPRASGQCMSTKYTKICVLVKSRPYYVNLDSTHHPFNFYVDSPSGS